MAIQIKQDDFVLPTSPDAAFDVNVGFQPDVVLFFGTARTADGITSTNRMFMGLTDGADQGAISGRDEDDVTNANTSKIWKNDKCFIGINIGANSIDFEAGHVVKASWPGNGFRININNAPGTAFRVGYMAIKGLEQWEIGNFVHSASGFDDINVGFDLDGFIAISSIQNEASGVMNNANEDVAIGFYDRTNQCCTGVMSNGGSGEADCFRTASNSQIMRELEDDGTLLGASEISTISNGFRYTVVDNYPISHTVIFLAMKGPKFKVSSIQVPGTSPTDFTDNTVGFTPVALFLTTVNHLVPTTHINDELRLGVGGTDGTTDGAMGIHSQNDADPTNTQGMGVTDKLWVRNNQVNTITAEAEFKQWNPGLGFTLTQTLSDNTDQVYLFYMAMGQGDSGGHGPLIGNKRNRLVI